MIHVLTHNILPVFAMLALGFVMGRTGTATATEARAINRIAFLVLQPPLIFLLMIGLDLNGFDIGALALYGGSQVVVFTAAYLIARHLLHREHLESWLLGMTVIFINSLLYIWPITLLIYGQDAALPVTAIVAWDSAITFSFFIITTQAMAGRVPPVQTLIRIARNPVILAIIAGLTINLTAFQTPEPILTAARFASVATAPLTLFALGVILSGHLLTPSPTVVTFTALKLVAFPVIILLGMATLLPGNPWQHLFTLTAAGPSGAMAFSLAMLYGVRTDAIAPVIIWTSTLSLFSLAYLA
ncbi:AEC family transporter [Oceaniglobus ichthyenteri]|uniref:AEC family transporter n=1 Tax=Oceaniglobus ichthyenteri TaxID=2136177 RepID=UPI000D3A936A|nr:AEC family transporter [Oceaniglobus ichthyenteri]